MARSVSRSRTTGLRGGILRGCTSVTPVSTSTPPQRYVVGGRLRGILGLAGGRIRRRHMAVCRVVPGGQVLAAHAQRPAQKGELYLIVCTSVVQYILYNANCQYVKYCTSIHDNNK